MSDGRPPALSLRSAELEPGDMRLDGARLIGMSEDEIHLHRQNVVDDLVRRRARLIAESRLSAAQMDGRVLIVNTDAILFDGVAAATTNGFFDTTDLPPWDTWLAYRTAKNEGELLSWVPSSVAQTVMEAMRTHVAEAFRWDEFVVE